MAGLTCELLWTASQHSGDCECRVCFAIDKFMLTFAYADCVTSPAMSPAMSDHDNMNAEMFMNWVQHRLVPTFNAVFGPGTELGGVEGKKMICIMVCTKVPVFILSIL
jgi:hypothetical protein